jgi:hypothetical protein
LLLNNVLNEERMGGRGGAGNGESHGAAPLSGPGSRGRLPLSTNSLGLGGGLFSGNGDIGGPFSPQGGGWPPVDAGPISGGSAGGIAWGGAMAAAFGGDGMGGSFNGLQAG